MTLRRYCARFLFLDATSILVDRALQAGGQDNITVLLMGVEATEVNNG